MFSFDVEYIGWKAYGSSAQVEAAGWNSGCANPFATLAVIEPVWPVVVSVTVVTSPSAESWIETTTSSPGFRYRTFGPGFPDPTNWKLSGSGGPCGTPFVVR